MELNYNYSINDFGNGAEWCLRCNILFKLSHMLPRREYTLDWWLNKILIFTFGSFDIRKMSIWFHLDNISNTAESSSYSFIWMNLSAHVILTVIPHVYRYARLSVRTSCKTNKQTKGKRTNYNKTLQLELVFQAKFIHEITFGSLSFVFYLPFLKVPLNLVFLFSFFFFFDSPPRKFLYFSFLVLNSQF